MDISYEKLIGRSFVKLKSIRKERENDKEDNNKCEDFELKTILLNVFADAVEVRQTNDMDGIIYTYDITNKVSLRDYSKTKSISSDVITLLIASLIEFASKMDEHMLSEKLLVKLPELIFLNDRLDKISFVLYPENALESKMQFGKLAEFIINTVDYSDEVAMNMAYEFYDMICREEYAFDAILRKIEIKQEINVHESAENIKPDDSHIAEDIILNDDEGNDNGKYAFSFFIVALTCSIIAIMVLIFRINC